jgi:transcriptional regulator with XRE-family HTH domain
MPREPKIEEAFGEIVRRRRQQIGISQEKLAELSALHRTYISQIERGLKSPSLKAMIAISKALNVKLSIMLRELESSSDIF